MSFPWSRKFRVNNGFGGGLAGAFGLEGLAYWGLDTTEMKDDRYTLELQAIVGIGIDFQAGKGLDLLPRPTGFKLKGSFANKYLWTSERGFSLYNPGTLEFGVGAIVQLGGTLKVDQLLTEFYWNVVRGWNWLITGDESWRR